VCDELGLPVRFRANVHEFEKDAQNSRLIITVRLSPLVIMPYVIKAPVPDVRAKMFVFTAQKTMYGGKHIAPGDTVFVFASENSGGQGLIARGRVTAAEAVARKRGVARQTPRVSVPVRRDPRSPNRPLGRSDLKPFTGWKDGRPETELAFKFYRQATDKIAGISDEAAAFLRTFF
jgi:hypothetical protein